MQPRKILLRVCKILICTRTRKVIHFHQLGLLGRVGLVVTESVCVFVCVCVCLSPSHAIFFKASHWPSGHMIRSRPYRFLCSVLLGTADNVIWPVLSFQVDAHWGEFKGIKSYLQHIEGAKIWRKQLSPSWMGYPPESSKPVISQHSILVCCSGSVCMFVCLCVCMFKCVCVHLNMCALVYVCVRWLMLLKVWQ